MNDEMYTYGSGGEMHEAYRFMLIQTAYCNSIDASAIDNAECDDRSKQHCHRRLDTAVRGDCSLLYRDNCCALQRLAETRKAAQISVYAQFLRMTPYWYGSTIILKDGFVYFVDEEEMSVDQITEGYCYFKARHMKYRIIPD